jgi:carbamoyl-phosphate synthase small subunit
MNGLELASKVSTKEPYFFGNNNATYKIAALDIGIKKNILRCLGERDAYIKVFPFDATYEELSAWNPDGYFLSNGPGDPQPLTGAINLTKTILEKNHPLFGICLGHQLLALACGAKTAKMKFGHHGANHPVQEVLAGLVMITSQNHGFVVDEVSLPAALTITHRSLFDQSIQGLRHKYAPALSFQGHPEAGPGPTDGYGLFDDFLKLMENHKLLSSTSSVTKIV